MIKDSTAAEFDALLKEKLNGNVVIYFIIVTIVRLAIVMSILIYGKYWWVCTLLALELGMKLMILYFNLAMISLHKALSEWVENIFSECVGDQDTEDIDLQPMEAVDESDEEGDNSGLLV